MVIFPTMAARLEYYKQSLEAEILAVTKVEEPDSVEVHDLVVSAAHSIKLLV